MIAAISFPFQGEVASEFRTAISVGRGLVEFQWMRDSKRYFHMMCVFELPAILLGDQVLVLLKEETWNGGNHIFAQTHIENCIVGY